MDAVVFKGFVLLLCFVTLVSCGPLIGVDPCEVDAFSEQGEPKFMDRYVPDSCLNGTFRWAYPRHSIYLHFLTEDGQKRSVCIHNEMLGDIFTIRDVTDGLMGMPMIIGNKESCTMVHTSQITLQIDAPMILYYVASVGYHVYIE